MDPFDYLLLTGAGLIAGIINVSAGGGSLLIVPLLIFLGVPAGMANATARPAILVQNAVAVFTFRRAGLYDGGLLKRCFFYLLLCLPGTLAGAWYVSTRVSDRHFEKILSLCLIGLAILIALRGTKQRGDGGPERSWALILGLIGVGFYGGFIQAGVGFLIVSLFLFASREKLREIQAIKVALVLGYTPWALFVFIQNDLVLWKPCLALAAGQSFGGYFGGRLVARSAESLLRSAFLVMLVIFAICLAF